MRCLVFILLLFTSFSLYSKISFKQSQLPIFIINTHGDTIVDEPRIIANMKVIWNNEGLINKISSKEYQYNGNIEIEIRGNTSQSFPKKQYVFETKDSNNVTRNVQMLDLPLESDWILHAPYSDKTLMRNVLTSTLFEKMGHYAPKMRLCELVLNGEYMGAYVLSEKIKKDKYRVDISTLKPNDISGKELTGGYLLQIDRADTTKFEWNTNHAKHHILCEYPKKEDIQHQQKKYIEGYINAFEKALYSKGKQDQSYLNYIDINSFVDFFIINEMSKNIDAYRLSTYMYKKKSTKGGKLHMGPVWDFNIAYGNVDYRNGFRYGAFVADSVEWWKQLLEKESFYNALSERWISLRNDVLSVDNIYSNIDSLQKVVKPVTDRNFEKWDVIGRAVWPNYYVGETYNDEIIYLKKWIFERILWMDKSVGHIGNDMLKNLRFKLFPNPVVDDANIEIALNKPGKVDIRVYDFMGKEIMTLLEDEYMESKFYSLKTSLLPLRNHTNRTFVFIVKLDGEITYTQKLYMR